MEDQLDFDAVVIGGGPGGSTLGALLAKEGVNVAVIEREKFPRFQIGESLLPATVQIFERLGVHAEVKATSVFKPGGKWNYGPLGSAFGEFSICDDYASFKSHPTSYMVERATFDQILLNNCQRLGACVMQETSARDLIMENNRVVGVVVQEKSGEKKRLMAKMVFDCTGRNPFIGNKLTRRVPNPLKRMAVFAHYEGAILEEHAREGWFVGGMIHNGWVWIIPLVGNRVSVGVVCEVAEYKRISSNPEAFLDNVVKSNDLLKNGLSADLKRVSEVRVTGNVGYTSDDFRGEGWVMVGDAAFFIDPCYSSGVHLAMETAELAARQFLLCRADNDFSMARFDDYQRKLKQHEKVVYKMVNAFYLCSVNYYVRKLAMMTVNSNWVLRKFATFTGGDFNANNGLINVIDKFNLFVHWLTRWSRKNRMQTVAELMGQPKEKMTVTPEPDASLI